MMGILCHRAFSETTPESAENGDISDSGMLTENEEYSFRELVRAMRDHSECSSYPPSGDICEWLRTGYYVTDYRTGTYREETLHYSRDNPTKNAKYWRAAMRASGVIK